MRSYILKNYDEFLVTDKNIETFMNRIGIECELSVIDGSFIIKFEREPSPELLEYCRDFWEADAVIDRDFLISEAIDDINVITDEYDDLDEMRAAIESRLERLKFEME